MDEKLHSSETARNVAAWMLRLGGLALAATGIISGIQTKDWGIFAKFWSAGTAVTMIGEAFDPTPLHPSGDTQVEK